MAAFNNFGTVNSQRYVNEFNWKGKTFYSYLISFEEYQGLYRIIRESIHEQALIGSKMLFNYDGEEDRIIKYRILGYELIEK